MGIERVKFSAQGVSHTAIAVGRVNDPPHNTHVGVVYKDRNSIYMLHLGWHNTLLRWDYPEGYACVIPPIKPERMRSVSALCRLIWKRQPKIPFSFKLDQNVRFNIKSGDILLTLNGIGLNCSNFAVVIYLQNGIQLIDFDTWQERPLDKTWHEYLIRLLERTVPPPPPPHVAAVRKEVGCARIRPEEVAGACLEEQLPTAFSQCERNGHDIVQAIDDHASPPKRSAQHRPKPR
jgi:hypothetical protein